MTCSLLLAAVLAGAPGPDLGWFRDARFGLFIHWGPVSLQGTEIGWSRGGERRGTGGTGQVPLDVYDNLYRQFNPTRFDARQWVRIAAEAGMKYLVFTTRHHDGFSMFDSALTDYDIMATPFGRDVTGELAAACHEAGLRLGFYHSPPDWRHPDYRTANHARFLDFFHGQLTELCSRYGRLDILWFDGLGGTKEDWRTEAILPKLRALQPAMLINNRAGVPGDFDTPEQQVGTFQRDRMWESCITIGDQWAWRPNDRIKSFEQCLRTLARCAGGDGNLLFNVGPMPSGEIEPRQVAVLRKMGDWLRQYGVCIYGTRGGPFRPGAWGVSTCRGNTVYLLVDEWQIDRLDLPALPASIVGARVLGGGWAMARQAGDTLTVGVPRAYQQQPITVVELELDRPAFDIPPVTSWPRDLLSAGADGAASNVYGRQVETYGPRRALDADPATRWATDAGTHSAWLEVHLKAPQRVGRLHVSEAFDRVRAFTFSAKVGEEWRPLLTGTTLGADFNAAFPPTVAQFFRLQIREATEGPTLWEVQLLAPRE